MTNNGKPATVVILRRIIQVAAFIAMPGLFTNIFAALKEIYMAAITGSFSLNQLEGPILLLLGSLVLTVFLGRFFCGFICSFGTMGDLLWFISKKTIKHKFKMPVKADKYLKYAKYVVLAAAVVMWTFGISLFKTGPWTVFGIYSSLGGWTSAGYLISAGGLMLLIIIIGSLFIERFFCRYICPLGAVFAIVSKLRIFRIKKRRENCGSCRLCTNKCSMGIPLYEYDTVSSAECINCFNCVAYCPRKNAKANPAPAVSAAVSAAAMCGLIYAGNIVPENIGTTTVAEAAVNNSTGSFKDGTYTGTGTGFRGETKTSVKVENGNITDITVVSYEDDRQYFERAESVVISEIISNQSVNVDAVSGATFSSRGIIESVANALSISTSAQSDASSENTESKNSAQAEASQSNASESSASQSSASESNASQSNASKQTASESNTDKSTSESTGNSASFADGTYTGTGTGFRGETQVSVTVEGGKITDITVKSYQDDEPYFERAESTVIDEILKNQSIDVDAVSGATFSSNGIKEAVAKALSVDFTNPNSTLQKGGHGGSHQGGLNKTFK